MRNDSNVLEVSFWGDENVPEILSGDGQTNMVKILNVTCGKSQIYFTQKKVLLGVLSIVI